MDVGPFAFVPPGPLVAARFPLGSLGPAALVLWILLLVKAYQGDRYELPIAGDVAADHS